jgi:ubiquitin C-terminal hydrolase
MSKHTKYSGRGLTGLENLGNTCFLNSMIQCLSHIYEFNDFLDILNESKLNNVVDTVLLIEYNKLRKLIWSENCSISPAGFVASVQKVARIKGKDLFTGFAQNDVPEFLLFMIDSFHNSLSREVSMVIKGEAHNAKDKLARSCYDMMKKMYQKEYSEILGLFYGIHVSCIICPTTSSVLSFSPEPYFMLNLPIPNKPVVDILDCFELYTTSELLSGEEAWYNEKTKSKQSVNKRLVFWSLPKLLVLDLKRFNNSERKNHALVNVPLNGLNLDRFVEGYQGQSNMYDLFAVCNHLGGIHGGHYTATVRNANNSWYLFNDLTVKKIPDSRVISPDAYCLFFRKKT